MKALLADLRHAVRIYARTPIASAAGQLLFLATALGFVISIWFSQFLRGLAFLRQAEWRAVSLLDWRVLGLLALILLCLTALVSLAPALGLKRIGIAASSRRVAARATLIRHLRGVFFGRDNVVSESVPVAVPGGRETEIIGVLADLSYQHPSAEVGPLVFLTSDSAVPSQAIIRSSLTAADLQQQLEPLDAAEGSIRLMNVTPLRSARFTVIAADRARGLLTIATAGLVVLLSALGFYGTQRYLVTAGRREYAIRASLGAGPSALSRLVITRGLWMSLPGLAAGGLLAFIAVALLRDDYLGRDISPGMVTAWVVAGLVLLLIGASFGPARTASRTEPAPLLRED